MLTPSGSTATALALPTAFMAAPPSAPAVLAERMKISRRDCAPRPGLSLRSWTSSSLVCIRSALQDAHGDVAARHSTALYSIRHDFFPAAAAAVHSPLHSAGPTWNGGSGSGSGSYESCFASALLAGQHTAGSGRGRWSATRLEGLRKPRGADGSPSPAGDGEVPGPEADEGGDVKARVARSREQELHRSSIPASKRQPPEEDDIWSKHSVFEFKSLNDPDTNACGYKGLSGQPRAPSSDQRRPSQQGPAAAPEMRLTSAQQPPQAGTFFDGVEELLEAERTASPFGGSSEAAGTAAAMDDDLFRFREKGAIAGTGTSRRRDVERRRRGPAGGGRGGAGGGGGGSGSSGSAVKVELATQLGVPATATYEELRTAYRVEIKRCHPDLAGDNEFRVKFLERKFQKLQGCWDKFSAEQTTAGGGGGGATTAAEAEAGGQAARARARARERAQEMARDRQRAAAAAAAAASARRSRRPVMDEGRNVLDSGNTNSC